MARIVTTRNLRLILLIDNLWFLLIRLTLFGIRQMLERICFLIVHRLTIVMSVRVRFYLVPDTLSFCLHRNVG